MNAAVTDPPRERGDLFDRSPGPVAGASWVDTVIDAVKDPERADELRRALDARLGSGSARDEKRDRIAKLVVSRRSLLNDLVDAIPLPDGAESLVRIIRTAVLSGTSRDLLARDLTHLIGLIDQHPGPGSTPPGPDRTGAPAPGAGRARDPISAPWARPAVGFDPDGPFRVPDRVCRFGDGLLAAPLFQPGGPDRGPGPVRAPSALPAPPRTENAEQIRAWARGEPVFTDSLGVRVGLLSLGDPGDLMEIESEFHTDPKAALRLYKARPAVADGTADAAWCARLGRDIGRFWVTHERAVEVLSAALARKLSFDAERAAPLIRQGAVLIVREELAEAVCGLLDAEQDYLSDGPADPSGPPQNLMGSFSPSADLSEGRCLERALFLHLDASVPLGAAMRQSLTEFRLAQAARANPVAPAPELDRRYETDPALPLAELSGLVPIVRLGYTEPALL